MPKERPQCLIEGPARASRRVAFHRLEARRYLGRHVLQVKVPKLTEAAFKELPTYIARVGRLQAPRRDCGLQPLHCYSLFKAAGAEIECAKPL